MVSNRSDRLRQEGKVLGVDPLQPRDLRRHTLGAPLVGVIHLGAIVREPEDVAAIAASELADGLQRPVDALACLVGFQVDEIGGDGRRELLKGQTLAQGALRLLLFGHVHVGANESHDASVDRRAHAESAGEDVHVAPILVAHAELHLILGGPAVRIVLHQLNGARPVVGMQQPFPGRQRRLPDRPRRIPACSASAVSSRPGRSARPGPTPHRWRPCIARANRSSLWRSASSVRVRSSSSSRTAVCRRALSSAMEASWPSRLIRSVSSALKGVTPGARTKPSTPITSDPRPRGTPRHGPLGSSPNCAER